MKLVSTNPASGYSVVGSVDISTDAEIHSKVAEANKASLSWKEMGIKKRISLLKPICKEFKSHSDEIASLITNEMGKPLENAKSEASGYIKELEWFFNNAEAALAEEVTYEDTKSVHKIVYEPFGTAAVITPWNYPFGMAIWGVFPNLIAGNTAVFKTSEECPLIGKFIEKIMTKHLPKGVFSEVYGAGDVGEKLARSNVNLIWFTGSSKVGKLLYKIAAEKFIKVILELGGSNPCIVFEDVDVKEVAPLIYNERFWNCGQSCDALKRLIVHKSIFDILVSELKNIVEKKKIGDPRSKVDLGSLVAKRQVVLLEEQMKDAVNKGAHVITGGHKPKLDGAFYEPTILTNITKDMRVWKEEVFGPVLPVISFKTEDEAIALANDTSYGLGSRILSKNKERAKRVAARLEAGTVEINGASRWLSCNPFGGYKNSGMGREHGIVGFRELCQIKVVSIEK